MYKIDNKSFDVTSIIVLISHDHQSAISKPFDTFVNFFELKSQYFHNVLYLKNIIN